MSDTSGKTVAKSLAIVEKKPQRPGGCVGIFFQLFDWNRRLAKKKLFSKKLLPPVRLKKASKKFGGDEKLPKLRLIADENSGGFPNMKKSGGACNVDSEQKHEMRTPGLVARLMGLEAMPSIQRDKLKKASLSGTGSKKGDKSFDGHGRFERQNLGVEKRESKHELRPQKLQKTGMSERRAVTRFGAEALQLKNVLSRSRKQHQKLVSPVKSPRNLPGKNASRLIGAAAKILEPGLQRSSSKCVLTYSSAVHHPPVTENLEETTALSLEPLENSNYFMGAATAQNGQSSSCSSCAHLLGKDFTANTEERPPVFSPILKSACLSSCQMGNPRVPMRGKGKDQDTCPFYDSLAMDSGQPRLEYMVENKPLNREGRRQLQASTAQCKFQRDVCPSVGLERKGLGQKQMLQERDRLPVRSKLSRPQSTRVSTAANATNETRNLNAMNSSLSNHTGLTMPAKMGNCQLDADRKFGEMRHDSSSPVRKRRSMNISRQNERIGFVSSNFIKPTNAKSSAMPKKDTNSPCSKTRLLQLQGSRNGYTGKNEIDVVSFTFNSQMKQKAGIHAEVEETRKQNGSNCEFPVKKSALQKNDGNRSSQRLCPISGDSLGALLEQKLRELTCQEEDELNFGDTAPKKTTAIILQELISALTAERPHHKDDLACKLKNQKSRLCTDDHQAEVSSPTAFQSSRTRSKSTRNLVGCLQELEHFSPGSVLEASFSNGSCASSSLDDGSGHNLCAESTEFCNDRHSLEPDTDLLDSATSLSIGKFYRESVIALLENISEVFGKINLTDVLSKGGKLTHAKEVILNSEMVFGNAARPGAIVNGGFSVGTFVLNELETLASVMWANFIGSVGFDDTKDEHQVKRFVFDCVIEYLDSRFSRYSNSGFNSWMRLPLRMKTEMLIGDIVEEVGRWAERAGWIPDELIEYEMSHSLGKWIDFELEAFETGAEVDLQILQTLIDELVNDFTGCRSSSLGIACC